MTDVAGLTLLDRLREAQVRAEIPSALLESTDAGFIASACRDALPAVVTLIEAAQEHLETRPGTDADWIGRRNLRAALAPFVGEAT